MATAKVLVPQERLSDCVGFDGFVQLISVDGQRTVGCPYWDLVADVGAEDLRRLYTDMAVVRRIDAEAMALQRQGELALWAPLLGPGGRPGGLSPCPAERRLRVLELPGARRGALQGRRSHCDGAYVARQTRSRGGIPRPTGWRPRPSSSGHRPCTPPGYALGIMLDGRASAAVAYFGDGASSEGDVSEALGFAASFVGTGRLLLPEQPVGDLGTGPVAVARHHRAARVRGTASPGSRSTATTSWPCWPRRGWRSPGPTPARDRRSSRP